VSARDLVFPQSDPSGGISLRDFYASQALGPVAARYLERNGFHGETMASNIAGHCYKIADAMIERGSKK
jgi:hypothetical protein